MARSEVSRRAAFRGRVEPVRSRAFPQLGRASDGRLGAAGPPKSLVGQRNSGRIGFAGFRRSMRPEMLSAPQLIE
jgi:hypothetical protein